MFKVIRLNIGSTVTTPRIARLRSTLEFHHVTGDTLQMFKFKGQGHSVVICQQQKRYNTAMDRFSDLKLGMAS